MSRQSFLGGAVEVLVSMRSETFEVWTARRHSSAKTSWRHFSICASRSEASRGVALADEATEVGAETGVSDAVWKNCGVVVSATCGGGRKECCGRACVWARDRRVHHHAPSPHLGLRLLQRDEP